MSTIDEILSMGKLVDPILNRYLSKEVSDSFQPILKHQISTGGKRVRASLSLLSCEAAGGLQENGLFGAALVELIHNYSLIIDDIIDRGELRRGVPTTRSIYSEAMALLSSMFYRECLSELTEDCQNPHEIRSIMIFTIKELIEGERLDILMEQTDWRGSYIEENRYLNVKFNEYLHMIGKKTAALIGASCEIGSVEANASKTLRNSLLQYGWHIGLAFQIVDDFLDIFGEQTGKTKGKDIIEHKLGNAVIIFTLQNLPCNEQQQLLSIIQKNTVSEEDLIEAFNLINNTNAKDQTKEYACKLVEKSKNYLSKLSETKAKQNLIALANFIVERTY